MNRNLYPAAASTYAQLLPVLRDVAKANGYALGLHGSLTTDLDLIAAPWTEEAIEARALVDALAAAIGAHVDTRVFTCKPCADRNEDCPHARNCPSIKPHGRRAWSIYLSEKLAGPYIDVSVMPRVVVDTEGGAG